MQDSRQSQHNDVSAHLDASPAMHEESTQETATATTRTTRLLAKVPQLSVLATAFFAAAPVLASPTVLGGSRHG